ncbi:MAG: Txe/YoeB family addiction module toxin [Magnetospirillum sp.]|nr:Txe/YoeB family addiction module toxin [Magnetospirillum sp.]
MNLQWTRDAWDDYLYWQETDRKMVAKVNDLIRDVWRTPFSGLGKPEPLKENLKGWWSRRISGDHRLIYRIQGSGDDQRVEIAQARYHY